MPRLPGIALLMVTLSSLISPITADTGADQLKYLFKSGEEGYKCFRIPAVVKSTGGTVLAFAEGRRNGCSDTGSIDLVMKRSPDDGRSWGDLQVVWSDGANTCGNPAPVVDRETGRIFLLSTWNLGEDHEPDIISGKSRDTRRVFVLSSADEGQTWSDPIEITGQVKKENWTWYATGPVHGIQLRHGEHRGRLLIPCDHIEAVTKEYRSHVIYSDDHGDSWQLGGIVPQDQVNECTVAELEDGSLLLNMRNYDREQKNRRISYSRDGGMSWSDIRPDQVLVEPICQASMLMFERDARPGLLLFLNPASREERVRMTLRMSPDQGRSWPVSRLLHEGPSAYSDMVQLNNREVLLLMETGVESPYEGIAVKAPVDVIEMFNNPGE